MSDSAFDGTPLQEGLDDASTQLTGEAAHFSSVGLRLMVVTDRRFVDQPGNRSRSYVEYSCRDLMTGETVSGVRHMSRAGGIDDGDEVVLSPITKLREGARTTRFNRSTPAIDTDGHVVLVGFIEGSRNRGVILGAVPHTYNKLGATSLDGERRLVQHKGTRVEVQQTGACSISRKDTTILLDANGDVTIEHSTGSTVKIDSAGDIDVFRHASGHGMRLSDGLTELQCPVIDGVHLGSGTDHLIKGDTFKTAVVETISVACNQLQTALAAAVATLTPDVISQTASSATVETLSALLTSMNLFASTMLTAMSNFDATLSTEAMTG